MLEVKNAVNLSKPATAPVAAVVAQPAKWVAERSNSAASTDPDPALTKPIKIPTGSVVTKELGVRLPFDSELWSGTRLVPAAFVTESQSPGHSRWLGAKMPVGKLLTAFKWFLKHHAAEVLVQFFYHREQREWLVLPLPQYSFSGLSVDEENGERRNQAIARHAPHPWVNYGSAHHHCGVGPAPSGTDTSFQRTRPGLHIILGNLPDKLSMSCMQTVRLPAVMAEDGTCALRAWYAREDSPPLSSWLELPDSYSAVPAAILAFLSDAILSKLLVSKDAIEAADDPPEWWEDMLGLPPESAAVPSAGNPSWSHLNDWHYYGGGYDEAYGSYGEWYPRANQSTATTTYGKPAVKRSGTAQLARISAVLSDAGLNATVNVRKLAKKVYKAVSNINA